MGSPAHVQGLLLQLPVLTGDMGWRCLLKRTVRKADLPGCHD